MMTLRLADPSAHQILTYLQQQSRVDYNYQSVGRTRDAVVCRGFITDHYRRQIGIGQDCFLKASELLMRAEHLRLLWVLPLVENLPFQEGQTIGLLIRVPGIRVMASCRIVYLLNETGPICRRGFAYGTLNGHPESGEERFQILWDRETDNVWYEIGAFSRPNRWYSRIGSPLTRRLQQRFAHDSMNNMEQACSR